MQHLDEGVIHALADGEISSADLPPITLHLEACSECRSRMDEARDLAGESDRLINELLVPEPSGTLARPGAGRASARTETRNTARSRRTVWIGLAWAASITIAVGLGFGSAQMRRTAPLAALSEVQLPPARDQAVPAPRQTAIVSEPKQSRTEAPAAQDARPSVSRGLDRAGAAAPQVLGQLKTKKSASQVLDSLGDSRPEPRGVAAELARPVRMPALSAASDSLRKPLPRVAENVQSSSVADAKLRDDGANTPELQAGRRASAGASGRDYEIVEFAEAVRRLAAPLRQIDGLVPVRLEASGKRIRVVYPTQRGELVLEQWRAGDSIMVSVIPSSPISGDSLQRLLGKVR